MERKVREGRGKRGNNVYGTKSLKRTRVGKDFLQKLVKEADTDNLVNDLLDTGGSAIRDLYILQQQLP